MSSSLAQLTTSQVPHRFTALRDPDVTFKKVDSGSDFN
jgi:hypothetical protein